MDVDLFDFELPADRIAQAPARPRDAARLLYLAAQADGPSDHGVRDLPGLLKAGDVMVFNDTRVLPTRLTGSRGAATRPGAPETARIEVTLTEPVSQQTWRAFARPARKLEVRDHIVFAPGFACDVVRKLEGGQVELWFSRGGDDLMGQLEAHGRMPLPPYIKRDKGGDGRDADDAADYQTLFAEHPGAVASPTAALHFTPDLLAALEARGVETARLTLHVGPGTFLPVKTGDTDDHVMHAERARLDAATAERLDAARRDGRRIVACGTTVLRTLESATGDDGALGPFEGETDLFITPGYRFKAVDALMTNFHLPRSTLFMLVAAFAGLDRMRTTYAHAVRAGYRFYSYGDASLLERRP